jgi:glycosyltransferase domain-containing protein
MSKAFSDVTILLTLRGRHLHTLRWLWHANRIRLPFPIVVADGEVHPAVAGLLRDPRTFPNLQFEYREYTDLTFTDFYRKCVDALGRVRTPYVMMSDNDDFLFSTGIQHSVSFLEGAPDYVSSGAGVASFAIRSRHDVSGAVVGEIDRIAYRPSAIYDLRDVDDPSATKRALDELQRHMAVYYNVYRIDALRTIAAEILALDFSDLEVHEYFSGVRAATLGKIKSHAAFLSYLRQVNTHTSYAFREDWIDHLLRSRVPQDIANFASSITSAVVAADGGDAKAVQAQVHGIYIEILRHNIAHRVLRYRFPRLFALRQRMRALRAFPVLPLRLRRHMAERALWRRLAEDGAGAETIAAHAAELSEIDETLRGDAFLAFARQKAPELIAENRGRSPSNGF